MARCLRHSDYTIGWVCALPDELTAAQGMLDEEHQGLPPNHADSNIYTLGSIGAHNIVLACLPADQMGTNSAAAVAIQMTATFPALRFALMVGIGGGVPGETADIRLGDVVVSQPANGHGGVVQCDFGKSTLSVEQTGYLNAPPAILQAAVTELRTNLVRRKSSLSPHLSKLGNLPKFARNQAGSDVLFEADYRHDGLSCTATRALQREKRTNNTPMIHYGTIASGHQVMRSGVERDKVSTELGGILCFETEVAGLMNDFPCLVIRGIYDYADSHTNKSWQPYAAGAAAAYTKELLGVIPPVDVVSTKTINEARREAKRTFCLPWQQNTEFVGRSTELAILKQKLLIKKDCQKVSLSGVGGIGKTQVALQFAYSVKTDCPEVSIFWVQAPTMEFFDLSCTEIAKALGIRQTPEDRKDIKCLIRQHLSMTTAGKWLLIIDNADDLDLLRGTDQTEGLLAFLPDSADGMTIFTTRHKAIAEYLTGSDVIKIGKMTKNETIDLLETTLVQKTSSESSETMTELLIELEYIPLAITQAAAYMNVNEISVSEYLRLLEETEQEDVKSISTDVGDESRYQDLTNTIAKTFTITFNKIRECHPLSDDILSYMSCIEWSPVPRCILPPAFSEALSVGAIDTLYSYSFLKRRVDGKIDMHRLVHIAMRLWIDMYGNTARVRLAVLGYLSDVYFFNDCNNPEIWREGLPHVASIVKDEHCQDTEERSELCFKTGMFLLVDGRAKEAVRWLQESCSWRDSNLPCLDSIRLSSQHALAMAYQSTGQFKEAVQLQEYLGGIDAVLLPEDHPSRLALQHLLAISYHALGQAEEAVELLEHVVRMKAEEDPSRQTSERALAILRGDHDQETTRQALDSARDYRLQCYQPVFTTTTFSTGWF